MRRLAMACMIVCGHALWACAADSPTLKAARDDLQAGRYDEALEAYTAIEKTGANAAQVAIGKSQAHQSRGEWKQATALLEAAVKADPKNAPLAARLAEVLFLQGRYEDAEKHAAMAIEIDADQPLAHLVEADVFTETGRLQEAADGYLWFIRYYNRAQPEDADTLVTVARGSAQHARWKGTPQIFNFTVNTLCPDAIKNDKNCWQAYHTSGSLLLEKYNRAQAMPELQQALAINPRATAVLVEIAAASLQDGKLEAADEYLDRALKIDPAYVDALQLKADIKLNGGHPTEAREFLQKALEVNPREQRTLGRLAASYLLEDGLPDDAQWQQLLSHVDSIAEVSIANPGRFAKLFIELAKRNPHPGYFLTILASTMEQQRKFDVAERLYRQAIVSMPQLSEPKTSLGMLCMSIGKTEEAGKLLDDAFKADPFHIRVSNMRKVLKLLDGYEAIQTDHFVIRVDTEQDKILGKYMAQYLEEVYPQLVQQFGFEPPQRTQFEIYHNGKGLSAHQWFSARMVGLPWIQTIGASTGMIVALASPTAAEEPFNWARVVKHEFVHIITLQQTKFNIPHWFTEALAVESEGFARPQVWNDLLLERVPKGELRNLSNLNEGFTRPESPLDWQFAYCQSRLYAQYLVETHGKDAIPKLLDLYRQNVPTEKAIPQVAGVDLPTFEAGYRKYLETLVGTLRGDDAQDSRNVAQLETAYAADPTDHKTAGAYAYALLKVGNRKKARMIAEKVLDKEKSQPLAALVLAELELRAQDLKSAERYLEAALDRDKPHGKVLILLAKIKLQNDEFAEAAKLCELGHAKLPQDADILRNLAIAYLKLGDNTKLKPALAELAAQDADDAESRKKLAHICFDEKNFAEAEKYAKDALHVDVLDVDIHRVLAAAHREQGHVKDAIAEYEVASTLAPTDDALAVELCRALIAGNRAADAKTRLDGILKRKPGNADASELLKSLK
jgi:tetratricopeptide (TPR) repeat protein